MEEKETNVDAMADDDVTDKSTLFVRGLGPKCTGENLEAHFSGVGPIRHSFVVTDSESFCKGYGFVQFTNEDDAASAINFLQGSLVGSRKIRLHFARRRMREGGRGTVDSERAAKINRKIVNERTDGLSSFGPKAVAAGIVDEDGGLARSPKATSNWRMRGSSTANWSGSLSVRTVLVKPPESDSGSRATSLSESAVRRILETSPECVPQACLFSANGSEMRCVFLSWPIAGKAAALLHENGFPSCIEAYNGGRKCRVIVRNLPYRLNSKEMQEVFGKVGKIRSLNIPKVSDISFDASVGKNSERPGIASSGSASENVTETCPGFAFVEYFLAAHAKSAISMINGAKIGGRVVAVDLAVGKQAFQAINSILVSGKVAAFSEEVSGAVDATHRSSPSYENEDGGNDAESHSVSNAMEGRTKYSGTEKPENSFIEAVVNNGDAHDDDEISEGPECKTPMSPASKLKKSAEELPRTVFVRNLPFETSSHELHEALSKYGVVDQALLVIDPVKGRPRGTAFVRFRNSESAAKAVETNSRGVLSSGNSNISQMVPDSSGTSIGGRPLLISRAVDRSRAQELGAMIKTSETQKEDTRNLRLAWIGQVKPGTKEAIGLSQSDLERRAKAEREKRAKLSHNPNAFVSDVRLSVRNIPRNFDEKVLKHLFLCGARGIRSSNQSCLSFPKISHCKIVRDEERNGRSKCYGFVQFEKHEHAISALNTINNNPKALELLLDKRPKELAIDQERGRLLRKEWGDSRRLVVEFAIEDVRQVRIIESVKARGRERAELARKSRNCNEKSDSASTLKRKLEKNVNLADEVLGRGRKVRRREKQSTSSLEGPETTKEVRKHSMIRDTSRPVNAKKRTLELKVAEEHEPDIQSTSRALSWTTGDKLQPRKSKKKKSSEKFEALVESYRRKVTGAGDPAISRWFD